ncbi:MAG: VCBS repeat-containing protein [Betaproteobacteria bacterium]|nr:MAG: VCBS repeat-containing protein [Betaproteobacteria bacterium]
MLEVVYGASGAVNAFAANFEQRCNGSSAPLYGRIRYNSSRPLFNPRGDHDGDGRSDILWRNASTGENYLYPMNGTTILAGEGFLRTVADLNWKIAGVGDFDGDGKADILWRNSSTGENYIWLMNGLSTASQGSVNFVDPASGWQVKR